MNMTKYFLNFVTVLLFLSLIVGSSSESDDYSKLETGQMYLESNQQSGTFVKIMSNISYTCLIKFDCKQQPGSCDSKMNILWLIPRELVEYQIIHGNDSGRIKFSQDKGYLNGNPKERYYLFKSQMNIREVGAIHNGDYWCSHDKSRSAVTIDIPVRGQDKRGSCHFSDHCLSGNCYQNKCVCDKDEVFVSSNQQCYGVAAYDGACSQHQQCSFNLGEGAAICSKGRCACNTGYTLATLALIGKKCLKIVPLDQKCEHSDQCSKNDDQSYCNVQKLCRCKTGYHMFDKKCKPFKGCDSTLLGENTNFSRGSCDENQWCSRSVCLCRPNYKLNEKGYCSAIRNSNNDNEMWYEKYGYYIIGILGAFLLMAVFMIVFQVKRYRQQTRNPISQTNSRDHLNRS